MAYRNIGDSLFGAEPIKLTSNTKLLIADNPPNYQREYEFEIHLDRFSGESPIDTKAKFIKGDKNTSILRARINKYGLPLDLTDCTVTANIKESHNDVVSCNVTIIEADKGYVEINLPSTIVDEQGENLFEICIQKDNKVTISEMYKYTVLDSLGEGDIGSETELTTLQSLIQQVQNQYTELNNITTELDVTQSDIDDIMNMVGGL